MGILRLGTGRHSLSKIFLAIGCAALLASSAMAAQIQSTQASANLRIHVRVLPTVATAPPQSRHADSTGSVQYNLRVDEAPAMTRQITIRPIRADESPNNSRSSGKQSPALLETVTVVGE